MRVEDIMHSGVVTVTPSTPAAGIARIMKAENVGAVLVMEHGNLIGIVTDRDIVVRGLAANADAPALTARQMMTGSVVCCHDTDDVDDAIRLMEQKRVRRLPVLSRKDEVVGIVSVVDMADAIPPDVTSEVLRTVSGHPAAFSA